MSFLAFLAHLLGFIAPAVGVALLLWLAGQWSSRGRKRQRSPGAELLWLALGGTLVLLACLVFFGRDGKMATYAALVLVQGGLAAWLWRG
jgi:Zn-dependent protease with chaperone function